MLLPVIPKFLDLQGSVLTGQGLGRYGSSQLADVTIGPDGTLKPLTTTQVLLGLVAHPWAGLDVYGYAGQEQVKANFWNQVGFAGAAGPGGYGNPAYLNGGCFQPNTAASLIAALASTLRLPRLSGRARPTSSAPRKSHGRFLAAALQGDLGQVRVGAQYEFVRLQAFAGTGTPLTEVAAVTAGPTPNAG